MKKNPKYDRKSFSSPSKAKKASPQTPGGSVFKSNPVYKGDNSPKTDPTAFGGKQ